MKTAAQSALERASVMQAFAEGKVIEVNNGTHSNSDWIEVKHPVWNWDTGDYRVRPEPETINLQAFWIDYDANLHSSAKVYWMCPPNPVDYGLTRIRVVELRDGYKIVKEEVQP